MKKLAVLAVTSMILPFAASAADLPWGAKTDEVAWEILVQIVSPAGDPGGNPKVEFETWASDQDIFQASPAHWPSTGQPKELRRSVLARSEIHGRLPLALPSNTSLECPPPGLGPNGAAKGDPFPETGCVGEEVRRNWASFQYIVNNSLDTKAGRAAFSQAGRTVAFPSDAIEFKGDWVPVHDVEQWVKLTKEEVEKLYYVSTATVEARPKNSRWSAFTSPPS